MTALLTAPQAGSPPVAKEGKRHILLIFAGLMVTMLLASLDQMIFTPRCPPSSGSSTGLTICCG